MSRGFVKEDDLEHAGTDLPERPISEHPNYVTPQGLRQLEHEAKKFDKERALLVAKKDDGIAKQKLAIVDRDLRYLSARLEKAILVEPSDQAKDIVLFGASIEVEDEEGKRHHFKIVGEDEANIVKNKVSWVSPLANALISNKIGDSVKWKRPAGDLYLEIISIDYLGIEA
jgi:transcription elongation GreA/GreB family factor